MPALTIKLDADDLAADLNGRRIHQVTEPFSVTAIPGGMQSGKPSVALIIPLEDGAVVFAETSLALFLMAADALKARHGDPRGEPTPAEREAAQKVVNAIAPPAPVEGTLKDTREGLDTSTRPDGQQREYLVLSVEERAKGYVRPVRRSYLHVGKNPVMKGHVLIKPDSPACGTRTTMGLAIAETYAREPGFYSGTFCVTCGGHFPVGADGEFIWEGTTERVGT